MSGGILALAKRDARQIVTAGGFQENITLSTPNGSLSVDITGLATKHWTLFDTDGQPVNSKNAQITLIESYLVEKGYPVRKSNGEVSLLKHIVSFPDSSGVVRKYTIRENLPDETLGIIVAILGDYTD